MDDGIQFGIYSSPIGNLLLGEDERGTHLVSFDEDEQGQHLRRNATRDCARTRELLDAYFAGHPVSFPYPEGLRATGAEAAVWRALTVIPFGGTRTYGAVAREVGLSPRQVGRLVGRNRIAVLIPCHRVVGRDGRLVGFGGGLARKRWLLDHETRHAFAALPLGST